MLGPLDYVDGLKEKAILEKKGLRPGGSNRSKGTTIETEVSTQTMVRRPGKGTKKIEKEYAWPGRSDRYYLKNAGVGQERGEKKY